MARFCRSWRGKNISAAGVRILLVCRHKIFKRYQVVRQILASQLKYRLGSKKLELSGRVYWGHHYLLSTADLTTEPGVAS